MCLLSRCARKHRWHENSPVGASCPSPRPFPTALRKSKRPQIRRWWGHLEHTRRNWGDKAEMMRRFKMLPSISKCNTQQTLKETTRSCVDNTESGGFARWVYTQCPQDEHTRGPGAKGLRQEDPGGCWKRLSWQKWGRQERWITTQRQVCESTLVLRQGFLARQAVLKRETKVRPLPYRSQCVGGTRK